MIDFYCWQSGNNLKIYMMLEETGLAYTEHVVTLRKGEQQQPADLAVNPNGKVPAITDRDGPSGTPYTLFESGAILIYLAGKTGKFLPQSVRDKYDVLQWLMFQMGGVGPMFGQAHHFIRAKKDEVPYGTERYVKEAKRLYGVMDKQLAGHPFLAADEYTIADIATFPWAARHEWHRVDLAEFPNVKRWFDTISRRPAVMRGMAVPFLN